MKLTGQIKRKILYEELFQLLKKYDTGTQKEIFFHRIMKTNRKFRADFYCPKFQLIVEVNGGQWILGRHNRAGIGYENDLEKINLAQINGIHVLQFTYEMLERGLHIKNIENYCKSACYIK
jgi:very-short-patch-repair endonuclease